MANVEMKPVSSSNVSSVGYDADQARLYVEFTSGATYLYRGVERETYNALLAAESIGKFLAAQIKGKYAYEQVSG